MDPAGIVLREVVMKCPKCRDEMDGVAYQGIEVDRCRACQGLWFDRLERRKLIRLDGAEKIDIGDAGIGREFDELDRIECPVCDTQMIRMVDPVQRHIWFEACTACNGVFLDAGEFRDLKQHTLLDHLKDLFTPERR